MGAHSMKFGHDDVNPAADYIKEVSEIQIMVMDKFLAMSTLADEVDPIVSRIRRAEMFRAGVDPGALMARTLLSRLEGDLAILRLEGLFGDTIHSWPTPDRRAPRLWHFRQQEEERYINSALSIIKKGPITTKYRQDFYRQIDIGQDLTEDAGGFLMRCWKAMLSYPFPPAYKPLKLMM